MTKSRSQQPQSQHRQHAAATFSGGMLLAHPQFGAVRADIHEVTDDPEQQVAATIAVMRKYATEDAGRQEIGSAAHTAFRQYPGTPESAIWTWVRNQCTFQLDPQTSAPIDAHITRTLGVWRPTVEILIRPVHMLTWRRGDCDDYSMLVAAMLLSAGIRCTYVTVAADRTAPDLYSHVYVAAYRPLGSGGERRVRRTAIDASHGPSVDWEAQGSRRKEWLL